MVGGENSQLDIAMIWSGGTSAKINWEKYKSKATDVLITMRIQLEGFKECNTSENDIYLKSGC